MRIFYQKMQINRKYANSYILLKDLHEDISEEQV